jgi:hypothetical protein
MMGERREISPVWGRRERIGVLWHGVEKVLEKVYSTHFPPF